MTEPLTRRERDAVQADRRRPGGRLSFHLPAVGILFVTSLLLFLPGLPHLAEAPFGNLRVHPVDSAWLYSLAHDSLWKWPPDTTTHLFDFPDGWTYFNTKYVDIGNATLATPLTAAFGPTVSYNVFLILLTLAAALAAYALTFVVTGSRAPSTAAGVLFSAMDPLLFAIQWGEDDVATVWLLPAFLAVLLWSMRRSPWAGLAVGAVLGVAGWFNHYYLVFHLVVTAVVVCWGMRRPARVWRDRRRWVVYGGTFLIGFALVYGPRASLGMRPSHLFTEADTTDHIRTLRDLTQVASGYDVSTNLDLSGLLNPFSPRRRTAEEEHFHEGVLYCGLFTLALAWIGLRWGRPRHRRVLLLVGATGLLLSLGTYLQVEGELVILGESRPVPLPYGVAAALVPFLERIHHPFRFVSLWFMVAAVLAGCGAAYLADRLPRAARILGICLLIAVCVAERLWASPGLAPIGVSPVEISPSLANLTVSEDRPGVLHLPLPEAAFVGDVEGFRYQIYSQLQGHHLPVALEHGETWLSRPVSPTEMACRLERLSSQGVGAVVLSTDFDTVAPQFTRSHPGGLAGRYQKVIPIIRRNLRQVLPPVEGDDPTEIYSLPDPGELVADAATVCGPHSSGDEPGVPVAGKPRPGRSTGAVPVSPGQEPGPNSPYPLSFPKMFAAIVYFDESAPSVAVSQEQARDLLPPVSALARAWEEVREPQHRLNEFMECEQIAFVVARKGDCETIYTPRLAPPELDIGWEIAEVVELLRARRDEPPTRAFVPCPRDRLRVTKFGETPLIGASIFDTACGILEAESTRAVRVSPDQASGLFELFDSVVEPLVMVNTSERMIRSRLSAEQIEQYMRDIDAILELKRERGGEARLGDDERTSDLLSVRVLQILEARADGRAVPPDDLPRQIPGTYVEPGIQPLPEGSSVQPNPDH